MPTRPCLDCGALSDQSRCPTHRRARDAANTRAKRSRRPYTNAERERRAATVRAWVAEHGWVCPGDARHAAHPSEDLTADHPIPVAAGGSEQQSLSVLCRRGNGEKQDRFAS